MPCDLPSGPSIGDRRLTCANASSAGVQGLLGLAGEWRPRGWDALRSSRSRGAADGRVGCRKPGFLLGLSWVGPWDVTVISWEMDGGGWGVKLAGEFSCGSVGL